MTLLVLFDFETTGKDPAVDGVCQFAALAHRQGDPVDDEHVFQFETLCNPGMPIHPEASAVNHITDEMVADAPDPRPLMQTFLSEVQEMARGDHVVIGGHNSSFDFGFLAKYAALPTSWRKLCTMRLARRLEPKAANHKLEHLYREHHKLDSPRTKTAHDAMCDVWMSFELLLHWMKIHNKKYYAEIAAELASPVVLETMPFGKHGGKPFSSLPRPYLSWIAAQGDQMDPDVLHTARAYLGG